MSEQGENGLQTIAYNINRVGNDTAGSCNKVGDGFVLEKEGNSPDGIPMNRKSLTEMTRACSLFPGVRRRSHAKGYKDPLLNKLREGLSRVRRDDMCPNNIHLYHPLP